MSEQSISSQIDHYFGLVKKYRWLLIVPFCIAMAAGIYFAITLPRMYEASTLILVVPQRVPENYVRSVVSASVESRINTISQQILSRSNLEKIIGKFGLFSDPKYSGMFLEEMVAAMRKRIEIKVNRGGGDSSFSINFRGSEPKKVMDVTNTLASSFINENLKVREDQAIGTSGFLADELEIMRRRLEGVENQIREYNSKYMGELPEQLDANLSLLGRLQTQLSEKERSLRDEKSRLLLLENQIENNLRRLRENRGSVTENGAPSNLEQLKTQLAALKSSYTERHPDVIKLKAKIAEIEANNKSEVIKPSIESSTGGTVGTESQAISGEYSEMERQRVQIKRDIRIIQEDILKLKSQMQEYEGRIERTPKREQELLTFKRNYSNLQYSYNSLLNRKLEAEISVNMEKKQKGEQFRIVDRAVIPQKPVSPDVKKIFLLSVAVGLGIGCGIIFLLDFFNTSLREPKDYDSELGLAVLTVIPKIYSPKQRIFQKINLGLTTLSLVVAAALTAGFTLILVKGSDPMLKIVSQYIKI